MQAIWLRSFGAPSNLRLEETPDPPLTPPPNTALITVTHVNITFVETQIRAGNGPFQPSLPAIPGNGVGGIVRALGPGLDPALLGARVVGSTGGSGAYAELALVSADVLYRVPDTVPLDAAVALLADGRTASLVLDAAGVKPGERVLVEAAAGGVGTLLTQLAKAAGATVIALAGGERKTRLATELGADLAIDYLAPDWPTRLGGPVDVVFDGVGGEIGRTAFAQLAPGGRMVLHGLASGRWTQISEDEANARAVTIVRPTAGPADMRRFTESALLAAAEGRLRPVIGQRFPLERAADAHTVIESRQALGKTLLTTVNAGPAGD